MLDVKLVVIGGAPEGDEYSLELPCTLGRAREASLTLPHPLVSRRHCQLWQEDRALFVRDLNSTNGTFVGSERIDESRLQDGDLLTIGTVTFRILGAILPKPRADQDPAAGDCDTGVLSQLDTVAVKTGEKASVEPRQPVTSAKNSR